MLGSPSCENNPMDGAVTSHVQAPKSSSHFLLTTFW